MGHLPAGYYHHVQAGRGLVMTEHLARQALYSVPDHSRTNLSGRCDTEPGYLSVVTPDEKSHQPTGHTPAVAVDALVFFAHPDVLVRAEPGHRPTLRRTRSDACGPSHDGAE